MVIPLGKTTSFTCYNKLMADWDKLGSRGNVEDRRGTTPAVAFMGGGGLLAIVITLALNYFGLEVSPGTVSMVLETFGSSQVDQQKQPAEFQGDDAYEVFASKILGSTDDLWSQMFRESNASYTKPRLVLYRNATRTGCGTASSAVGPFYCPNDKTIYLDETFFEELRARFGGSSGDVAQAYVIAHEVGHHVQNLQGELAGRQTQQGSINTELQADCYAGVWAYSINKNGVLNPKDIEQALSAAAAVGDDNIQSKTEGRVTPENWTHGSSEQRVDAFNVGFRNGQPGRCSNLLGS